MAQFDVYPNPSKATRNFFPYLLDVQSPAIDEIATRIVIPLGRLSYFKNESMTKLTPVVEHGDESLVILTPQISSMQKNLLKEPIGTLEHFRAEILASLDFALTGI